MEMRITSKTEARLLGAAAFGCYLLALTACGVAAYALAALSLAAYGDLGMRFYAGS